MSIDTSKVNNIVFDGIDHKDYPEFCDAYICSAHLDGEPMNEEQINELNEDHDFVYEKLMNHLF